MDLAFAIKIFIELLVVAVIVIMAWKEDELIEFEHELYIVARQYVRKKMHLKRRK